MDVTKVVATLSAMVSSESSVEVLTGHAQLECVGLYNKAYAQLSLEGALVGGVPCGGC